MSFIRSSLPRSQNSLPKQSERVELARRLHDGLAQELVALGYNLDALIGDGRLAPDLRTDLRRIRLQLITINAGFRDEIFLLRKRRLNDLLDEVSPLFAGADLEIGLPAQRLGPDIEDALFHSLLEIARNSAQHSGCTRFSITTSQSASGITIEASDNGNGRISHRERSFGLASISEPLAAVGAELSCDSDASGTRYRIDLKLL